MKAITVYPEWAWAKVRLDKRVENRTWKPSPEMIGQYVAIHAGMAIGGHKLDQGVMNLVEKAKEAGWIVSLWNLGKKHYRISFSRPGEMGKKEVTIPDDLSIGAVVAIAKLGDVTMGGEERWSVEEQYQWHWDDVIQLPEPILCKGRLRLWKVPVSIEAEILKQVVK